MRSICCRRRNRGNIIVNAPLICRSPVILRESKIAQKGFDGTPCFESILSSFKCPEFGLLRSHRVSDLLDKDSVNHSSRTDRSLRYSSCYAGNVRNRRRVICSDMVVLVSLGCQHFPVGALHVHVTKRGCCHDKEEPWAASFY